MKKSILSMMAASMLIAPMAIAPASAQSRDVRQAERQLDRERRDLREAYRSGDPREIREERRET